MDLASDARVQAFHQRDKRDLLGLQTLDELGFNERNDRHMNLSFSGVHNWMCRTVVLKKLLWTCVHVAVLYGTKPQFVRGKEVI